MERQKETPIKQNETANAAKDEIEVEHLVTLEEAFEVEENRIYNSLLTEDHVIDLNIINGKQSDETCAEKQVYKYPSNKSYIKYTIESRI